MRFTKISALLVLLLLTGLAFTGCSDDDDPVTPAPPAPDGINGGRMFDKFWATETGFDQSDPNLGTYNDFKDFFRCKQCHGWDRLGNAGAYINRAPKPTRPNVSSVDLLALSATHSKQEMFDAIKKSTGRRAPDADLSTYDPDTNPTVGDQMPDYSLILTDAQIWELVEFLLEDAIDVNDLYESTTAGTYPTGSITFNNVGLDGDAAQGDALFAARCASCHGADGTAIEVDGDFTVGKHLRAKPNEDQHKFKFGQLGTGMTSLVTDLNEMKDLYKALTNTDNYPDDPPSSDGVNGGRMFDKFWAAETGFNQSDPNLDTYNNFKDFFRCKQCHGWDRLGNAGAYINRAPRTTRPNVSSVNLLSLSSANSRQEVFDAIKNPDGRRAPDADLSTYDPDTNPTVGDQMPDYSQILTDDQIWDLVDFLLEDAIDVNGLYDFTTEGTYPTGSITFSNVGLDGDATRGDALFAARCAICHSADGTAFEVDGGFSVGSHLRAKPNEDQHKFKFGQLGTGMTSLVTELNEMKDLYKALTNTTSYPDP